jgi:alginate O-acetyltransferase complex protein AlgI
LANLFLLLASLLFYFWGETSRVWVFIATVVIDYFCALAISGAYRPGAYGRLPIGSSRTRFQKTLLALSICANLTMLGYFKYFNFGVSTYNRAVRCGFQTMTIAIPN